MTDWFYEHNKRQSEVGKLETEIEKLKALLMEASKILQLVRTDRVDPLERDFAVDDLWGKDRGRIRG